MEEDVYTIIPDERISVMCSFYVSGLVTDANLIVEEIKKSSELLTEDSRGKLALAGT